MCVEKQACLQFYTYSPRKIGQKPYFSHKVSQYNLTGYNIDLYTVHHQITACTVR